MAAIAVLVIAQQTINVEQASLLLRTSINVLHFPMFVAITLLLARVWPEARLAVPALGAAGIALATEALQVFNDRHASVADLGLNAAGIVFAVGVLALSRWLAARPIAPWQRTSIRVGAALFVTIATVWQPLRVQIAYDQRDRMFPVIWHPAASGTLLLGGNSSYRLVQAPPDWPEWSGQAVLAVVWSHSPYPRIDVQDVVPDWSDFHAVLVDVYLPEGPALAVTGALGYAGHTVAPPLATVRIQAGAHRLRFELGRRARSGERIERFVLRVPRAAAGRTLLVGPIRLVEGRGSAQPDRHPAPAVLSLL